MNILPLQRLTFQVSWPDYLPVDYTKDRPEDINLHHHDDRTLSVSLIKSFNKQKDGINRKSYLGGWDMNIVINENLRIRQQIPRIVGDLTRI